MQQDRITDYLHSLESEKDPAVQELRNSAVRGNVPVIRRETESFLRTVCAAKRPEHVLELGTAIAYSTLVLAENSGHVTTVENYEKRIRTARENIRNSGMENRIRLIEGDAGKVLKDLLGAGESYDLIFLDAAKAQYSIWLEDLTALLRPGGLLIADNVLQEYTVMESHLTVDRRDRTTHKRMREFLFRIKHDARLESCVIPLGDGVSVSVRL